MKGISVAAKLNAQVALLVLAMLAIAGVGLYALHDAQATGGAASDAQREFAVATAAAQGAEAALKAQAPSAEPAAVQVHAEIGAKRLEEVKASLAKLGLDTAAVTQAARLQADLAQQYREAFAKPAPGKVRTNAPTPAADREAKQAQLRAKLAETRALLQKAAEGDAAQLADAAQARSSSAAAVIAAIILLVTAVGAYLRVSVRQGILRSIRAAAHVVGRVADGDLTAGVSVTAAGETQKLLEGLEKMTADLRKLVGAVAASAHTVADTSAQIAQGNLDLSQRTEEQASTLEETASSMEELTSTVAHNAENARQASQLAVNASEVARRAGEVVDKVVDTMDGISDASKKIADIIGVIDGIAFQTNILALNAAVEAARAGEQGRGFAVVAAEVRNLAQRSAAAAKEIKMLIGESVQKVQAGGTLVDAAGHTMVEVVSSVQKVSDLIADIAAASQEQSSGIGQVNTAVTQMEQVVQQNASLVEEATAATEAMKEQAKVLLSIVARFNIGQKQASVPAQPAVPAPAAAVPPPIKVRPSAKLPPAYAALAASSPKPGRNGAWEEF